MEALWPDWQIIHTFYNFTPSSCPGSSRDIGMYMTRIILRHREVGRVVTTMARMLHNSVTVGIQSNLDKWRKSVGQLERKHNKHYKSARSTLQRKSETLGIMLLKTKIINCRCQLARIGETEVPQRSYLCKSFLRRTLFSKSILFSSLIIIITLGFQNFFHHSQSWKEVEQK